MRVPTGFLCLALIGGTVLGCVRPGAVAPPNSGRYLISAVELQQVDDLTLYDAVRRLRPHFLRSRTATVEGKAMVVPVMLYVDGERMESLDELRRLPVAEVQEVRFYEPQLANTYFGRYNNAGGAIAVSLRWEGVPPAVQ